MGSEQADVIVPPNSTTTVQHGSGIESMGLQGQTIPASQFEIPDELLPSLNPKRLNMARRIIIHPMVVANNPPSPPPPPLAIDTTPLPIRRIRRSRPFTVSPFTASFGSEIGQIIHIQTPINTQHDVIYAHLTLLLNYTWDR